MVNEFSTLYSVVLDCGVPGEEYLCHIPLPRQSPLGIFEGQHSLSIGDWPATFLCLRHARSFLCSADSVRLETEVRGRDRPVPSLWKIECECAHENCGRLHTIYTARIPDWPTIVTRTLKTNPKPKVPCAGHDLVWREDLMLGEEFAHNSPLR